MTMKFQETSVIIPVYNRARYLPTVIESLLRQTYQDFEIIVVDDGSSDDVAGTLKPFHERLGDRLRFYRQENSGPGAARNTGIEFAKGAFIAFLDADDEWEPVYLEKCVSALKNSEYDWVCTSSWRVVLDENEDETGREILHGEPLERYPDLYASLLSEENLIGGPSQVVLKKKCFGIAGRFRRDLYIREDWEFWMRLAKNKLRTTRICEPLYLYKIRKNSITKTGRARALECSYRIFTEYSRDAFRLDRRNKKLYAEKMWNLARHIHYWKLNKPWLFIKCLAASQVYDFSPGRIFKSARAVQSSSETIMTP